ncbi:MAG: hypothetical protein H8E55_52060 [Pelagibacterales bacterium]|nr:hypothetical protein [Pelagibacterales bacterium]
MAKKELNKTNSSFSRDKVINRAEQIRRDDDIIKTPKCTIEDVDWAVLSYLQEIVKPQIIENNQTIDVPVLYANGEKWAQVQSRGYMRDRKGKMMTPLISIRRGTITERDTLKKLDVNQNPSGNSQILQNKFSTINRYDRFSLIRGDKPLKEFYVTAIPEFIDVSYELFLWTEYTEQLNSLIEQLMPLGGFAWGTTWKFPTFISDYTFETMNATGEDRLVRATLPLITKATLLMSDELRKSNIQKRFSTKRITFKSEVESFNVDVSNPPPGGYDNR